MSERVGSTGNVDEGTGGNGGYHMNLGGNPSDPLHLNNSDHPLIVDGESHTAGHDRPMPDEHMIDALIVDAVRKVRGKGVATSPDVQGAVNFAGMVTVIPFVNNVASTHSWIIDSGATDHITYDKSLFLELHNLETPINIGFPDGVIQQVQCAGHFN